MNGTPLEAGKVAEIVKGIRKRKGLSEEVCIFYYNNIFYMIIITNDSYLSPKSIRFRVWINILINYKYGDNYVEFKERCDKNSEIYSRI
jgi:hypothetical protein